MKVWRTAIIFSILVSCSKVSGLSTSTDTTEEPTDETTVPNQDNASNQNLDISTTYLPLNTKENEDPKYQSTVRKNTISQLNTIDSKLEGDHINDVNFINMTPTNSSNYVYTISHFDKIDSKVSDSLNVSNAIVDSDLSDAKNQLKLNDTAVTRIILIDGNINANSEGRKSVENTFSDIEHVALVPGQLAAILAGVFLGISVIGYFLLLSWRRYLENRYGNREMLVDDDYCEKQMNDLEHFSI